MFYEYNLSVFSFFKNVLTQAAARPVKCSSVNQKKNYNINIKLTCIYHLNPK